MKRLQRFSIAVLPLLAGCVSVSVPSGGGKKADGVRFEAPAAPFRELETGADRAWVNESTGNTISFISECGSKADPSLEQLQNEAVNSLEQAEVSDEKTTPFNGRQARFARVKGSLDGVAVTMRLVTLKKNSCNYTLTATGVPADFGKDEAIFDQFLQEFRAP